MRDKILAELAKPHTLDSLKTAIREILEDDSNVVGEPDEAEEDLPVNEPYDSDEE